MSSGRCQAHPLQPVPVPFHPMSVPTAFGTGLYDSPVPPGACFLLPSCPLCFALGLGLGLDPISGRSMESPPGSAQWLIPSRLSPTVTRAWVGATEPGDENTPVTHTQLARTSLQSPLSASRSRANGIGVSRPMRQPGRAPLDNEANGTHVGCVSVWGRARPGAVGSQTDQKELQQDRASARTKQGRGWDGGGTGQTRRNQKRSGHGCWADSKGGERRQWLAGLGAEPGGCRGPWAET